MKLGLRITISVVASVAILAATFFSLQYFASQKTSKPQSPMPAKTVVAVHKIKKSDFQEWIVGYGVAKSARETLLKSEISGTVTWISDRLSVGQHFKKGDKLVQINPQFYQQSVLIAKAALNQVEAQTTHLQIEKREIQKQIAIADKELAVSQRELRRLQNLQESNSVSSSVLDDHIVKTFALERIVLSLQERFHLITPSYERVLAEMEEKRGKLEQAKIALANTVIASPYDSRVVKKYVQFATYVNEGDPLLHVLDPNHIEIAISLPALDLNEINIGDSATLTVNGGSQQWNSNIVRKTSEIDKETQNGQVFFELKEQPLLPGSFVVARIKRRFFENVVVIPRQALLEGYVFVVEKNEIVGQRKIEVAHIFGEQVIVTKGLQPGEQVILSNLEKISDGSIIQIYSVDKND